MHLILATHNLVRGDGQGRVNHEIVAYGLRLGHEVTLLADQVDADLIELGAAWERIAPCARTITLLKGLEFAVRSSWRLRRLRAGGLVCANGFTVMLGHDMNCVHFVHSAWLGSAFHPIRTAKLSVGSVYQWIYSRTNSWGERRVLRSAQKVIAVSQEVARQLQEIGIDAAKITIVENGVDVDQFHPDHRYALRLPFQRPSIYALFVGDIRSRRKNLDTVLKALAQVPGLHLIVAGDTAGSPYPQQAGSLGLSERVHFVGYRNDLNELMADADFFLCPSRYEPFSLAVLEAMASGTPVICSRNVGAAELLDANCSILLDSPDDIAALASAMHALMSDAPRRLAMGQAARIRAESHTWEAMAERYWSLFEQMAAA